MVVIGIIAVFMGILLPVISRARDASKTVGCLSNLRQIVTACMSYSNANNGFIIPAQWSGTKGTLDGDEAWCNILVNTQVANAPDAFGKGPQESSIFHCPNGSSDIADETLYTKGNTKTPASRADGLGEQCMRYLSASKGTAVDCWYGINATFETKATPLQTSTPCRRIFRVNRNCWLI